MTNLFEVKGGKVCGNSKLVASSSDTPETSVNTIDAETAKKAVELGISCHQAVRFSWLFYNSMSSQLIVAQNCKNCCGNLLLFKQ